MSSLKGTPSKNRTASRSQSQNAQNLSPELRQDLALDIRRSQNADFDDVLKFNLFLAMKESQEKQDLINIQKNIEILESQIDNTTRANRVQRNQSDVSNPADQNPPEDSGQGSKQSVEMAQRKEDLDKLVKTRQEKLDSLLSECLSEVLPICNDDKLLRECLSQYSEASTEAQMYGPFARLCNHALDRLASSQLDTFRPIDLLNCRLHVNDTRPITTFHQHQQPVYSKPDVVITSTVAATDVAHDADNKSRNPVFDEPPKKAFEMRQILSCGEFKFKKSNLKDQDSGKSKGNPLTLASRYYNEERHSKYPWLDEDLSEPYPIDEAAPRVKVITRGLQPEELEAGERPAKRKKASASEQAMSSPGTRGESSKGTASKSRAASSNARAGSSKPGGSSKTKTTSSRMKGSRGEKGSSVETPPAPVNKSQNMIDARTQCAQYGMEMLSYAAGVHRAIAFLIHNCKLWVWYYDRQGVIQSDGIDFVEDLPRFLVLLFTFQRFGLADWGIIPELNPGAVLAHNSAPSQRPLSRMTAEADGNRHQRMKNVSTCILETNRLDIDRLPGSHTYLTSKRPDKIEISVSDWLSHQPHCLAGRSTAVLGSSIPGDDTYGDLACKISFPEVARQNEGQTIERLRKHIESDEKSKPLSKHLPVVVTYGDMTHYGTQRIRSIMRLNTDGSRTLRIMVSEKRVPLTTLAGSSFVRAWLEAVRFHAYLWAIGLEHGDPSLWNVMYDENQKCAVLGDYDLSILREGQRVPGTDRTGTIPFMAIELLNIEYWRGEIARVYRHELEALIWILPFVFLRYQDQRPEPGTLVEHWMTSDYEDCARRKFMFLKPNSLPQNERLCKPDYVGHWPLAEQMLFWLMQVNVTLLTRQREGSADDFDAVATHWPLFVMELKKLAALPKFESKVGYVANLVDELGLDSILGLAQPLTCNF